MVEIRGPGEIKYHPGDDKSVDNVCPKREERQDPHQTFLSFITENL